MRKKLARTSGCLFFVATVAIGGESRLDAEFFAFKPTSVLAVKESGKWVTAPRLFTLGANGKNFFIDARDATGLVPSGCRQLFSSKLPKDAQHAALPASALGGADTQQNYFWGKGCSVKLWMTGQRDPQFGFDGFDQQFSSKGILPKDNRKSASRGLIEFNDDHVTTIEFAVLVEDAPLATHEAKKVRKNAKNRL